MLPRCYICKLLVQIFCSWRTQKLCKQGILHAGVSEKAQIQYLKKLKLSDRKISISRLQNCLPHTHWLWQQLAVSLQPGCTQVVSGLSMPSWARHYGKCVDVGPPAGPCCHSPLSQRPGRRRKSGRVHPIVPLVSLDFVFSYTFVPHRDSFQRDQAIISLFAHPRGRLMDKQLQYEALPPQIQILD